MHCNSIYHSFPSAVLFTLILCKDYGYLSIILILFSPIKLSAVLKRVLVHITRVIMTESCRSDIWSGYLG